VSTPIHRVIVGTAGHIDHGKSTLVRVLTGIDPDRLKEEKARGMTIDLGFAPYVTAQGQQVGIIDVPGHERFVKNMVAGASSVDIFLLVVAADDGVMPQTREHVEILTLLGAQKGVVLVSKIDLVDPELRELAIADIADFLHGTPFETAKKIGVSATSGEGIAELRAELDALIAATPPRASDGVFRMPIQRVFSAKGQGTVVTGVPISGSVKIGDTLEILPLGASGRVRGIQAYLEERDDAAAGHSTAINLTDVDYHAVSRGMIAATPGYFEPAKRIEASLHYLESADRPLRHGADVRLHIGTAEVLARLVLLEGTAALDPGQDALVQFRLREPVVTAPGDRFLIRLETPLVTLGGGLIVAASGRVFQRPRSVTADATSAKAKVLHDRVAYFEQLLKERGVRPLPQAEAAALLEMARPSAEREIAQLVEQRRVRTIGRDKLLGGAAFDDLCARLVAELKAFHKQNPLATHDDSLRLRTVLRVDEAVFEAAVESLLSARRIAAEKGGKLRIEGAGPRLSDEQRSQLERIKGAIEAAGIAPPSLTELVERLALPEKTIAPLLKLLGDQAVLWKAGDFHFAPAAIDRVKATMRTIAAANGEVDIPKLRDALGTTRKYLIPLLESLDAKGFTVRRGDKRFVAELKK
jgi:selenocysteine-specific elongation factor